ncbi:Cytochrome P450 [Rhynchospora pubera]|uniref:Cytochrome P450 n=1 Tax=Rhynchospora pubera TaxID=906938 RepID=A0AAV8CBN3_9POAL|nr:Cytochrome P450 [Rhynchospora pubera]
MAAQILHSHLYGPYWRHVRKICILELLSQRRVDLFAPVRAAEVKCMISRISTAAAEGKAMNLSKILGLYANGVLGQSAFGKDFYGGGDYDRHGFQEMLEEYQVLLGGFSIGDFFPGMEWVGAITGFNARLETTFRRFDKFFDEIIEEHMQKRRKGRIQEEGKDLVDVLLDVKEGDNLEMPLTMDNVKAVILDMFAAGTDTTFISLDWGMTELLMNPGALKQAQKEVRRITGEKQFVSESDLCNMPYLKSVVKEIFRLHPPAPVLVPRESMEQVTIDGYNIPTKTRIYINAWAIGRDPELWEHPDEFKPERFLNSPIDYKGQHYELIPFGSGRRSCPAINFSTVSVELALAQLLHSFDWELPPGVAAKDLDLTEVFGITMHRIQQLVVIAKPYL